jgi:hypothetical protein
MPVRWSKAIKALKSARLDPRVYIRSPHVAYDPSRCPYRGHRRGAKPARRTSYLEGLDQQKNLGSAGTSLSTVNDKPMIPR